MNTLLPSSTPVKTPEVTERSQLSPESSPEPPNAMARLYWTKGGQAAHAALINGVVYDRARDQEDALRRLKEKDLETTLLALVPEDVRAQAGDLLNDLADCAVAMMVHQQEETRTRLLDFLPIHRAIIDHAFDTDNSVLMSDEAKRHMGCTLRATSDQAGGDPEPEKGAPVAGEAQTLPTAWESFQETGPDNWMAALATVATDLFVEAIQGWGWQRGLRKAVEILMPVDTGAALELEGEINSFTNATVQAGALLGFALAKTEPTSLQEIDGWTTRAVAYLHGIEAEPWLTYQTAEEYHQPKAEGSAD